MISALVLTALAAIAEPPTLEPGWRWIYEPQQVQTNHLSHGYTRMAEDSVVMADIGPEQTLILRHIHPAEVGVSGAAEKSFAFYLTTKNGERLRSNGWGTYANATYKSRREVFNVDPAELDTIGLAVLDLDGKRLRSAQATKAAADVGASALPLPVIGEPFTFDLPAFNGDRLRSDGLKGKVILIDHWATWCMPCMEKMPELRDVRKAFSTDDLVIIGVNFDDDPQVAAKAIDDGDMAWLHVHAPSTAAGYEGDLWGDMTGITTLPRLLLIDQNGILVDDFYPHDGAVNEKITELINTPDG